MIILFIKMSICCNRCKKEKDETCFKNDKNKLFKQCSDCREYNRNKKKEIEPNQVNKKQETNKKWKEENKVRIHLYNQHQRDLKAGKESNWEQILKENELEENKVIGKPSPHRKQHSFNEEGIEGKECSSCKSWKKLELYCKNKNTWDQLRHECKECLSETRKKNKEQKTEYNKQYWLKTQEEQKEKNKIWRENNQEHIKEKQKEYRQINGKEIDKKQWEKRKNDEEYKKKQAISRRKYENEKLKTDVQYKLKKNMRRRIREMLTNFGIDKSERTVYYVGCNLQDLRNHLENTFQEGMTWENYGEWHIDHIIPCSSWNLADEKELRMCFHYTNLQALWASENIEKKDHFEPEEKKKYMEKMNPSIIYDNIEINT